MKVYVTKNSVKRLKSYPNNNAGIQMLKDIRWAMDNDPEFKKNYEKIINSSEYQKVRTERSLRRTRKNIQDILNANLNDRSYLVTLTFAQNLQDYKKANAKFNYFIRIKNKDIKYLCIKEHQKRGAIHYHLIVFDINEGDLEKLKSSWTYGWVDVVKTYNDYTYSFASYLTKYFIKEKNQMVESGYRIFTKSTNLQKPLIISDKVVNKILDKYKYNVDLEAYGWLQHKYVIEEKAKHNLAIDFL